MISEESSKAKLIQSSILKYYQYKSYSYIYFIKDTAKRHVTHELDVCTVILNFYFTQNGLKYHSDDTKHEQIECQVYQPRFDYVDIIEAL